MKIHKLLSYFTGHVRKTKGVVEALNFYINFIQPLKKYFPEDEEINQEIDGLNKIDLPKEDLMFLEDKNYAFLEDFIFWIGLNYGNKGVVKNGKKFDILWYSFKEANGLWKGCENENLVIYTTKDLITKFLNK